MKAKCSMNDLISRSALLEELSKGTIITDDLYGMGIMAGNNHAMKKIEAAPAVDAVEVIKCQDCFYWMKAKVNRSGNLVCPKSGMEIVATDYCSKADKRRCKYEK